MTTQPHPAHPAVTAGLPGRLHKAAAGVGSRPIHLFVLTGADVVLFNDWVRSLCPSCITCSVCGGRVCPDCRIGDPVACTDTPNAATPTAAEVHHSDCQDGCDACVAAVRADARVARLDRPRP